MKKLKFFLLLPLAAFILSLNSCDEDSTGNNEPPKPKNYYPMTTGSFWVYNNYDLNDQGNREGDITSTDSTAITGTETLYGKQSYIYTTYTGNSQTTSVNYYKDGSKLYVSSAYLDMIEFFMPGIDLDLEWVLLADDNGTSWTIKQIPVNNLDIEYGSYKGKLSGTLTITGKKGTMKQVEWGVAEDKTVQGQEFILEFKFNGTFTPEALPIPVNAVLNISAHNYFAEDIGLVKTLWDAAKVNIANTGDSIIMNGSESVMINYSIK